jgi:hypothetical protein
MIRFGCLMSLACVLAVSVLLPAFGTEVEGRRDRITDEVSYKYLVPRVTGRINIYLACDSLGNSIFFTTPGAPNSGMARAFIRVGRARGQEHEVRGRGQIWSANRPAAFDQIFTAPERITVRIVPPRRSPMQGVHLPISAEARADFAARCKTIVKPAA